MRHAQAGARKIFVVQLAKHFALVDQGLAVREEKLNLILDGKDVAFYIYHRRRRSIQQRMIMLLLSVS